MNNAVGSTYFDFHHNCSFHRQSKISAAGAESDNEPHVIEPAPDSGGQDSGFPSIVKALVRASVWLCVAFLRKNYYVCGEIGLDIRKRNVTYPDELKKYDLAVETAGAQSPIFA